MVLALLACLAAATLLGMITLAQDKNRGPLAFWLGKPPVAGVAAPSPADDEAVGEEEGEGREGRRREESVWRELHEVMANVTLALVILHIGGVAWASIAHRENLARAMITGRKRPETAAG
jgi:cytochrome b